MVLKSDQLTELSTLPPDSPRLHEEGGDEVPHAWAFRRIIPLRHRHGLPVHGGALSPKSKRTGHLLPCVVVAGLVVSPALVAGAMQLAAA